MEEDYSAFHKDLQRTLENGINKVVGTVDSYKDNDDKELARSYLCSMLKSRVVEEKETDDQAIEGECKNRAFEEITALMKHHYQISNIQETREKKTAALKRSEQAPPAVYESGSESSRVDIGSQFENNDQYYSKETYREIGRWLTSKGLGAIASVEDRDCEPDNDCSEQANRMIKNLLSKNFVNICSLESIDENSHDDLSKLVNKTLNNFLFNKRIGDFIPSGARNQQENDQNLANSLYATEDGNSQKVGDEAFVETSDSGSSLSDSSSSIVNRKNLKYINYSSSDTTDDNEDASTGDEFSSNTDTDTEIKEDSEVERTITATTTLNVSTDGSSDQKSENADYVVAKSPYSAQASDVEGFINESSIYSVDELKQNSPNPSLDEKTKHKNESRVPELDLSLNQDVQKSLQRKEKQADLNEGDKRNEKEENRAAMSTNDIIHCQRIRAIRSGLGGCLSLSRQEIWKLVADCELWRAVGAGLGKLPKHCEVLLPLDENLDKEDESTLSRDMQNHILALSAVVGLPPQSLALKQFKRALLRILYVKEIETDTEALLDFKAAQPNLMNYPPPISNWTVDIVSSFVQCIGANGDFFRQMKIDGKDLALMINGGHLEEDLIELGVHDSVIRQKLKYQLSLINIRFQDFYLILNGSLKGSLAEIPGINGNDDQSQTDTLEETDPECVWWSCTKYGVRAKRPLTCWTVTNVINFAKAIGLPIASQQRLAEFAVDGQSLKELREQEMKDELLLDDAEDRETLSAAIKLLSKPAELDMGTSEFFNFRIMASDDERCEWWERRRHTKIPIPCLKKSSGHNFIIRLGPALLKGMNAWQSKLNQSRQPYKTAGFSSVRLWYRLLEYSEDQLKNKNKKKPKWGVASSRLEKGKNRKKFPNRCECFYSTGELPLATLIKSKFSENQKLCKWDPLHPLVSTSTGIVNGWRFVAILCPNGGSFSAPSAQIKLQIKPGTDTKNKYYRICVMAEVGKFTDYNTCFQPSKLAIKQGSKNISAGHFFTISPGFCVVEQSQNFRKRKPAVYRNKSKSPMANFDYVGPRAPTARKEKPLEMAEETEPKARPVSPLIRRRKHPVLNSPQANRTEPAEKQDYEVLSWKESLIPVACEKNIKKERKETKDGASPKATTPRRIAKKKREKKESRISAAFQLGRLVEGTRHSQNMNEHDEARKEARKHLDNMRCILNRPKVKHNMSISSLETDSTSSNNTLNSTIYSRQDDSASESGSNSAASPRWNKLREEMDLGPECSDDSSSPTSSQENDHVNEVSLDNWASRISDNWKQGRERAITYPYRPGSRKEKETDSQVISSSDHSKQRSLPPRERFLRAIKSVSAKVCFDFLAGYDLEHTGSITAVAFQKLGHELGVPRKKWTLRAVEEYLHGEVVERQLVSADRKGYFRHETFLYHITKDRRSFRNALLKRLKKRALFFGKNFEDMIKSNSRKTMDSILPSRFVDVLLSLDAELDTISINVLVGHNGRNEKERLDFDSIVGEEDIDLDEEDKREPRDHPVEPEEENISLLRKRFPPKSGAIQLIVNHLRSADYEKTGLVSISDFCSIFNDALQGAIEDPGFLTQACSDFNCFSTSEKVEYYKFLGEVLGDDDIYQQSLFNRIGKLIDEKGNGFLMGIISQDRFSTGIASVVNILETIGFDKKEIDIICPNAKKCIYVKWLLNMQHHVKNSSEFIKMLRDVEMRRMRRALMFKYKSTEESVKNIITNFQNSELGGKLTGSVANDTLLDILEENSVENITEEVLFSSESTVSYEEFILDMFLCNTPKNGAHTEAENMKRIIGTLILRRAINSYGWNPEDMLNKLECCFQNMKTPPEYALNRTISSKIIVHGLFGGDLSIGRALKLLNLIDDKENVCCHSLINAGFDVASKTVSISKLKQADHILKTQGSSVLSVLQEHDTHNTGKISRAEFVWSFRGVGVHFTEEETDALSKLANSDGKLEDCDNICYEELTNQVFSESNEYTLQRIIASISEGNTNPIDELNQKFLSSCVRYDHGASGLISQKKMVRLILKVYSKNYEKVKRDEVFVSKLTRTVEQVVKLFQLSDGISKTVEYRKFIQLMGVDSKPNTDTNEVEVIPEWKLQQFIAHLEDPKHIFESFWQCDGDQDGWTSFRSFSNVCSQHFDAEDQDILQLLALYMKSVNSENDGIDSYVLTEDFYKTPIRYEYFCEQITGYTRFWSLWSRYSTRTAQEQGFYSKEELFQSIFRQQRCRTWGILKDWLISKERNELSNMPLLQNGELTRLRPRPLSLPENIDENSKMNEDDLDFRFYTTEKNMAQENKNRPRQSQKGFILNTPSDSDSNDLSDFEL